MNWGFTLLGIILGLIVFLGILWLIEPKHRNRRINTYRINRWQEEDRRRLERNRAKIREDRRRDREQRHNEARRTAQRSASRRA